jgi:hypothetical protein
MASLIRALLLGIALCLGTAGSRALAASDPQSDVIERSVKAAYLYKFLGYIDWPPAAFPEPETPYVIGVAGADALASELAQITASRTVNNRTVLVRRMKDGDALNGVHLLFIGQTEMSRQPQWLRLAQQRAIVTVTETEGALAQGSVINFKPVDGRIRFEVSLAAAERADCKLSSRMLSVALLVRPGTER